MNQLTVIMCRSKKEGLLQINGQLGGPCGESKPISIPWDIHTPLYLSFYPFEPGNTPLCIQLNSIDEKIMPCPGAQVIVWPGVLEVILDPQSILTGPPPLMPQELSRQTFNTASGSIVSTIVEYCGTWWVLEGPRGTLMCRRISPDTVRGDVSLVAMKPAAFLLEGDGYAAVAGSGSAGFSLLYSGRGNVTNKDRDIVIHQVDAPCFQLRLSGDGSQISQRRELSLDQPSNASTAARLFLWAHAFEDYDHAYSMLSNALRSVFSRQDIIDFIGKVDDIDDCRFVPTFGQVCFAAKEKLSEGVYAARPFSFDVNDDIKIENITPLE